MRTCCLIIALSIFRVAPTSAQELAGGIYAQGVAQERHVMPQVVVRTPSSMRARAEASYLVDVWSRASVNLGGAGQLKETQTHHELSGRLGYAWDELHVGAHYRYVHRPDYTSHTIDTPLAYRLPDQASLLSLQPYLRFNHIGRVGNESFSQSSRMFGLRAGYQPWLGDRTIGQAAYEIQYAGGYLSSPYYYIGTGNRDSSRGCSGFLCLPEHTPDERVSHALVVLLRRALSESISAGLRYRFFIDDWSMTSHTIEPDIAWVAWPGGLLRLRYRAYLQSATAAYRDATQLEFGTPPTYLASDPRWSALHSHRVSLDVEHTLGSQPDRMSFTTLLSLGVYRVASNDRTVLSTALEATLWLLLAL